MAAPCSLMSSIFAQVEHHVIRVSVEAGVGGRVDAPSNGLSAIRGSGFSCRFEDAD